MPVLDIGQEYWLARIDILRVLALMLFPNDPSLQEDYIVTEKVKIIEQSLYETSEQARTVVVQHLSPDSGLHTLRRVLSSKDAMPTRIEQATHRGTAAGDLLMLIAQLVYDGHEGSVNKAVHILLADHQEARWAQRNRTSLLQAWTDYKAVSHLWAAWRCLTIWCQTIWQGMHNEEQFLMFLNLADAYHEFGTNHYSFRQQKNRGKPILQPNETWSVSVCLGGVQFVPLQERPSLSWEYLPRLSPSQLKALYKYKAPTRNFRAH